MNACQVAITTSTTPRHIVGRLSTSFKTLDNLKGYETFRLVQPIPDLFYAEI